MWYSGGHLDGVEHYDSHSKHQILFLNQARAGLRPARAWFLKIDPVRTSVCVCVYVCVCVCPPPRLLITSGVMWCDIDSRRLVKQVL